VSTLERRVVVDQRDLIQEDHDRKVPSNRNKGKQVDWVRARGLVLLKVEEGSVRSGSRRGGKLLWMGRWGALPFEGLL
jgi:hypothetical protein